MSYGSLQSFYHAFIYEEFLCERAEVREAKEMIPVNSQLSV